MKKVILSIISLVGAFSLMLAILVFSNIEIKNIEGWVKVPAIKQELNYTLDFSIDGGGGYFTKKNVYTSTTFILLTNFPTVNQLLNEYDIDITDNGDTFEGFITLPLTVRLNEMYYGGFFFNELWANERLDDFFNGYFSFSVENINGDAVYTDIEFIEYYSDFNSTNIIELFSWVIDAQTEAKESAPELQLPNYSAGDTDYNAIYGGFVYIGDLFEYILNYIKFIYAYFEIPINLYFV